MTDDLPLGVPAGLAMTDDRGHLPAAAGPAMTGDCRIGRADTVLHTGLSPILPVQIMMEIAVPVATVRLSRF